MKVIGLADRDSYVAIISHAELEKAADLYYGKMKSLQVGQTYNLGQAYDFKETIHSVCREMTDAMKAFEKAQDTMRSFAEMVAMLPDPSREASGEAAEVEP